MKRYDSVLVENYDHYLATMEKSDIGQYVRHEDVQNMLKNIRSTAFIQGYKKMIDKIIEKEGFEVEK